MKATVLCLQQHLRCYATSSSGKGPRSRLGPILSLDHFLQRARVLSFYRTIIRSTRRISDPRTRNETRLFARQEFERHSNVQDIQHIRYLLSTGKTQWESMERYIDGM
ncbi:unnamed protein product [Discula destructiva]